jgi:hypothetical protein
MTTQHFFRLLYGGLSGVLELRTVPLADTSDERRFANDMRDFVQVVDGVVEIKQVNWFINRTASRRMAAYFGVALRSPAAVLDRKGDQAHCQTLTALFVDADFKKLGEDATRFRVTETALAPSIIVNSGGGLHPYWRLAQPLNLQTHFDYARTVLQRLAHHVADVVDVSVSEPTRVLRIPGSYNYKYDPPRLVTVEQTSDTVLTPDQMPVDPSGPDAAASRPSQPLQIPALIAEGDRHATMRDLMRSLQSRGVPLAGALAACQLENRARCQPALDHHTLDSYLRRVAQLPDRPGFKRAEPESAWVLAGGLFEIGMSVDATVAAVKSLFPDFNPLG